MAASASVEVTPKQAPGLEPGLLPAATSVYVTALPDADPADLVRASTAIRAAGYAPVPHLAVRAIESVAALDHLLGRLTSEAGVDDVLVVAGGVKDVRGPYTGSLDVLRSGMLERRGILRVGVAGHPEGSPDVPPDAAWAALAAKNELAADSPLEYRIVTQFALAPEPYVAWERAARAHGNRLPITAGIPGVVSPARLLKFALACGIGPSVGVLRKQRGGIVRLATTRTWKPDAVAAGIAESVAAEPDSLVRGIHLFPFGGLQATAEWLVAVQATGPEARREQHGHDSAVAQ
jgi:methylenetetrahydrofolate reductase (NADPH)